MREKILIARHKKGPGKPGRKLLPLTEEMAENIEVMTGRGASHQDLANFCGMSPATLYRKLALNPELQNRLRRMKSIIGYHYKKRDIEYWNELIRRGAENRRLRKALQWKKFELMQKKNISYRRAHGIVKDALKEP